MIDLPEDGQPTAAAVVADARAWIGTPYHHQASRRDVGADCLGLVRGVYKDVLGREPEMPPAYSRDWGEANGRETLIEAARRHLIEIPVQDAKAGDVLVSGLGPVALLSMSGSKFRPNQ